MAAIKAWYRRIAEASRQQHDFSFPTLFWLFITGSMLGVLMEGIWHFLHHGTWAYRVATLYGPFCIIYGAGAVAMYIVAAAVKRWHVFGQFVAFGVTGSVIEYLSSLFQEICFGTISWDYSRHMLNLGGRVSLRMTLIWGIAGLALMYLLLPVLLCMFNQLRLQDRRRLCAVLAACMAMNLLVTTAALVRWKERHLGQPAGSRFEQHLDQYWPDERLEARFPNMLFTK